MSGLDQLAMAGAFLLWGIGGLLALAVVVSAGLVVVLIVATIVDLVRKLRVKRRLAEVQARREAMRRHPTGSGRS